MKIQYAIPGSDTLRKIEELYYASFPEEERLPFRRMALLAALKPSVELLAYYEGDQFCGFSFAVTTDRYLYINFFAVDPALRGQGVGRKMLELLRQRHPQPLVCDVKAPNPDRSSYIQDINRVHFWEHNGLDFFDNRHTVTNAHGIKYLICASEGPFDRDAYWAVFDHLSFGPGAMIRILKRAMKK